MTDKRNYLDCGDDTYVDCGDETYIDCGDETYVDCGDENYLDCGDEVVSPKPLPYEPRKDNWIAEIFYKVIVLFNRWFGWLWK